MNAFVNAGNYLVSTIFGFVLFVVLLRFWMQWVRADFRNPVGQFVIAITNPVVVPLRKILPSVGFIDSATVVFALLVAMGETYLRFSLSGYGLNLAAMLIFSLASLIQVSIAIIFVALFVYILFSWFNPYSIHPLAVITRSICEPLMAPVRRLLPAIGGIDISPIFVFILLQLTQILVVSPLRETAMRMAVG